KKRMNEEAERLNFEEAARIRDRISGIEKVLERQRIVSAEAKDMDVMGLAREGGSVDLQVLFFRGGMLVGRKDVFHERAGDVPDEEILLSFIEQFYSRDVIIPSEIILQKEITDVELVEKWLSGRKNGKVTLTAPKRGKKLGMLKLAIENAREALKGHGRRRDKKDQGVDELQQILSLPVIPERIEAFDISNIFGAEAVGSLVVWEQGKFKKEEYRHYRIRTVVGADDFAMMQEVVQRRYSGLITKGSEPPDLILIDGGKGQLNAVLEVLEGLGIKDIGDIGILGLAKAKGEKGERIFLPGRTEAIELDMKSPATHLLQRIRDEAHRFAISYHRKLRGKEAMISGLDAIKGIGRARKLALLKYFGSIEALKAADIADLLKAPRMTTKVAEELYKELRRSD
ncbi:MAG: excinuclease ABC subunit UvrC, partial [Nitrospirae bacterium]|nr:excinuclease ABC subunit UvrC [Nitrospirota bacterium]